MKERVKNKNGITLIALVITIIVLLILAGVTIATLAGENGILTRASEASEQTTIGQEKEQIELAYSSVLSNKLGDGVTSGELQDELDKIVGDEKTSVTGGSILKVTFTDTNNVYTISSNQGIEEYKKAEVTPVYAYLCDEDGNGTGETLVLSSTETIEGYTIITNYGDNEAYQTNEDNAEESWGSVYYYPIWKDEISSIADVIIYNKIVPTTTERWFSGCSNLEKVENISNLDTSNVTTMTNMFENCSKLASLDVSNFDTSSVTNMVSLFSACLQLTNLNLSNFDTSNVTSMNAMFRNCSSLTNLDLSSFDTNNVTQTSTMFYGCSQLKTILVSSQWTMVNINSYNSGMMFYGCTSLVGGAGTVYNASYIDATYAHIDEGETNPGYLTVKTN